jgi:hypothetical protein
MYNNIIKKASGLEGTRVTVSGERLKTISNGWLETRNAVGARVFPYSVFDD